MRLCFNALPMTPIRSQNQSCLFFCRLLSWAVNEMLSGFDSFALNL